MKKYLMLMAAFIGLISACKKDEIETTPLSTISMANAIIDGKVARLNDNLRDSCLVMGYKHFTVKATSASPLKVFASSTPNAPYFNQSPALESGGIYSLYLTGTATAPESVFVKDNIPPYPTDDVLNIRVVNLSPTSSPLDVVVSTPTTRNLFTGVAYKQVSDFITMPMPVLATEVTYTFQFKNAAGTVVTSYTLPLTGTISVRSSRKRNITLIVKGIITGTGTNALGVFAQAHY